MTSEDYFHGDDDKVKFYSGLHPFEVPKKTFDFIKPHVIRSSRIHYGSNEVMLKCTPSGSGLSL